MFGLFQTGYIYGEVQGMDIRNYGSGNAGATNALRTLGMKGRPDYLAGRLLEVCACGASGTRLVCEPVIRMNIWCVLLGMYAAAGCDPGT